MALASRAWLARLALRCVARYLRSSVPRMGKATLLQIARRWLAPAARRGGERVRLREALEMKMHCLSVGGDSPPDILTEWMLYTGHWQPALTRWLRSTLRPGDAFVDIGANTGYFALLAASCVGADGSVVAVEACPGTFGKLRANLSLNGPLTKCVRAVLLAASDARGHVPLSQPRNEPLYNTTVAGAGAGGVPAASDVWSVLQKSAALDASALSAVSALAAERACWREVRVEQAPLDDILAGAERSPRVVKIDVEGGEMSTLRGMERLLRQRDAPVYVVVELSPKWLQLQASSARDLLAHMLERGFNAYALPADDYEIARCHDAPVGAPSAGAPPRLRRLHDGDAARIDGNGAQLDVVFSRTDAEWLR